MEFVGLIELQGNEFREILSKSPRMCWFFILCIAISILLILLNLLNKSDE